MTEQPPNKRPSRAVVAAKHAEIAQRYARKFKKSFPSFEQAWERKRLALLAEREVRKICRDAHPELGDDDAAIERKIVERLGEDWIHIDRDEIAYEFDLTLEKRMRLGIRQFWPIDATKGKTKRVYKAHRKKRAYAVKELKMEAVKMIRTIESCSSSLTELLKRTPMWWRVAELEAAFDSHPAWRKNNGKKYTPESMVVVIYRELNKLVARDMIDTKKVWTSNMPKLFVAWKLWPSQREKWLLSITDPENARSADEIYTWSIATSHRETLTSSLTRGSKIKKAHRGQSPQRRSSIDRKGTRDNVVAFPFNVPTGDRA